MPNDDAVGKGGWGGENVSKSDDVILVRSLTVIMRATLGSIENELLARDGYCRR